MWPRPKPSSCLAERSARLGAAIVDGLIFAAMVYIPMMIGIAIAAPGPRAATPSMIIGLRSSPWWASSSWAWLTLRQMSATGQSLAKKYFNIKVVLSDGSPASLGTLIWKRNVLTWLLSIIPLYGIVEVLFIFGETPPVPARPHGGHASSSRRRRRFDVSEALDTVVAVETPEGIVLELRPAGLVVRFYAFVIDWLIRLSVLYGVAMVTVFMGGIGIALWLILAFACEWLYPIVFELRASGATPGKRVVQPQGRHGQRTARDAGGLDHAQPAPGRRLPAVWFWICHRQHVAAERLQAPRRHRGGHLVVHQQRPGPQPALPTCHH